MSTHKRRERAYLCPTTLPIASVPVSRSRRVSWSIVEKIRSADSSTRSFVESLRGGRGGGAGDGDRRGERVGLSLGKGNPVGGPGYGGGARCDAGEGVRGGRCGGVLPLEE